jgi:hypothetical protein
LENDPDFHLKYKLNKSFEGKMMDNNKRIMLEGIALEVLELLSEKNKETTKQSRLKLDRLIKIIRLIKIM